MTDFPSYIFANIQPCLKKPTGFLECFFHSQFKISFHFLPFNRLFQLFPQRIPSRFQICPLFFSVLCFISGWLFGWFFRIPLNYPAGNRLAFFYTYQPFIVIFKWFWWRTVLHFKAKPIIFLA